jgi:hypothetical protein
LRCGAAEGKTQTHTVAAAAGADKENNGETSVKVSCGQLEEFSFSGVCDL